MAGGERKQGGGREGWREGGKEPGSLFLSIQILSADKIAEVEYVLQWNWCLTPIGVGSLSMSFVVCCLVFCSCCCMAPQDGPDSDHVEQDALRTGSMKFCSQLNNTTWSKGL